METNSATWDNINEIRYEFTIYKYDAAKKTVPTN